ncbi:Alpha/Beta hydrolase protein [Thelephora terrestris]|uniref:Alpha/Beta hydrolase protein n=1 Tax=Thelephora terrestris TaxID=56493 RepID=A0A9P6HW88_9AGAM|nr:Alpha/Beta hydrolase protein [Thelephora terrestris]
MLSPTFLLVLLPLLLLPLVLGLPVEGIEQQVYDDLVRYTKYSSAVYQGLCPRPLGNTLVAQFSEVLTHTNGFFVRDDLRKETVLVFRGSDANTLADYFTDSMMILTPFSSPGVSPPDNTTAVHWGFLRAFNSVAETVISIMEEQYTFYPNYRLVCTGHSLGGALAALAAVTLRSNIPGLAGRIRLFTFGQPRTGNLAFSRFVEELLGPINIYRAVHRYDGVPTIIPRRLGYHHFLTEYWQTKYLAKPSHVRRCTESSEDRHCSRSITSTGINADHSVYFNHVMTAEPWLCLGDP